MKVVVFDLDDTLYDELTYVKSGFLAVARELSKLLDASEQELFRQMWNVLEVQGRGRVFDEVLSRYRKRTKSLVRRCLSVYRLHKPDIALLPDAEQAFQQLRGTPVYIVTDGNKVVQHNKLEALGLYGRVKKCYITHRYGRHHAKPSPYCLLKISQAERTPPSDIVYIGDNPHKDFVGIKPLGFRTIRIRRGAYRDLVKPEPYEAETEVRDLTEIFQVFERWRAEGCRS